MATTDLQLDRQYVVAGQSVTATGGPYTVSSAGKITVDTTNEASVKSDLGALVVTDPATVVYAEKFFRTKLAVAADNDSTKQAIFTVPAGLSAIVTRIVMRNASAVLTGLTLGFGFDTSAIDVSAAAAAPDTLATSDLACMPAIATAPKVGAAAAVFGVKVTVAAPASTTFDVDVEGYFV